jgi:hypothetical protein
VRRITFGNLLFHSIVLCMYCTGCTPFPQNSRELLTPPAKPTTATSKVDSKLSPESNATETAFITSTNNTAIPRFFHGNERVAAIGFLHATDPATGITLGPTVTAFESVNRFVGVQLNRNETVSIYEVQAHPMAPQDLSFDQFKVKLGGKWGWISRMQFRSITLMPDWAPGFPVTDVVIAKKETHLNKPVKAKNQAPVKPKKIRQRDVVEKHFGAFSKRFTLLEINMVLDKLIDRDLLSRSNRLKLYNSLSNIWASGGAGGVYGGSLYQMCIGVYGEKRISGSEFIDLVHDALY